MMDIPKKPGWGVAVEIVTIDQNGHAVSQPMSPWYGFDRTEANNLTMDLVEGVLDIANKYKEAAEAGNQKT